MLGGPCLEGDGFGGGRTQGVGGALVAEVGDESDDQGDHDQGHQEGGSVAGRSRWEGGGGDGGVGGVGGVVHGRFWG